MKRIALESLLNSHTDLSYKEQHSYINKLLESGRIKPLKASGTNGKKPALYREYWLIENKKDYTYLEEELKYHLSPMISVDYYLLHLKTYEQDRKWVVQLSEYLKKNMGNLKIQESMNERSYEIWNKEKFLAKEQGRSILKRCGMNMEFLNIYGTMEPLAYYSHTREVPQNLLILENKDTFYSMRRHLLEGKNQILGMEPATLIYGAGKRILRSFQDFDFCVEPYMKAPDNRIYYFGDLDYEGIGIYENLSGMVCEKWEIVPFVDAYEAMLEKAGLMLGQPLSVGQIEADVGCLPDTKEQQNRNIKGTFFTYFSKAVVEKMRIILKSDKYIPQEILNIQDF